MNDHNFNIQVAIDFDPEIAIFLNNMAFWLNITAANREHFFESRYWIYNSYTQWSEIFPYWTAKQIRRIISNSITGGLLIVGNFNEKGYDNTNWYSFTDKALEYYPRVKEQFLNTPAQTGKTPAQTGKTPAQTGRPIPYSNPYSNPDIKTKPNVVKIKYSLTLEQMNEKNPHEIPVELLMEWKSSRKNKPITERVMSAINRELTKIKEAGIEPIDAFTKMLEKSWLSLELSFFEKDISIKNGTSNIHQFQKKSTGNDSFSRWINNSKLGEDYDQFGNVIDPFRF